MTPILLNYFPLPSLQNLCIAAAYRPVQELIEQEKRVYFYFTTASLSLLCYFYFTRASLFSFALSFPSCSITGFFVDQQGEGSATPLLRLLNLDDFVEAKSKVC